MTIYNSTICTQAIENYNKKHQTTIATDDQSIHSLIENLFRGISVNFKYGHFAFELSSQGIKMETTLIEIIRDALKVCPAFVCQTKTYHIYKATWNLDNPLFFTLTTKNDRKLEKMFQMALAGQECDAKMLTHDGDVLTAHKFILGCSSKYFKSAFEFQPNPVYPIKIEANKKIALGCLEFFYTGLIKKIEDFSMEDLYDLVILADEYQSKKFIRYCIHYINSRMTIEEMKNEILDIQNIYLKQWQLMLLKWVEVDYFFDDSLQKGISGCSKEFFTNLKKLASDNSLESVQITLAKYEDKNPLMA